MRRKRNNRPNHRRSGCPYATNIHPYDRKVRSTISIYIIYSFSCVVKYNAVFYSIFFSKRYCFFYVGVIKYRCDIIIRAHVHVIFDLYTESVFLHDVKTQAPVSDSVYESDMDNCVAAMELCVFTVRSLQGCALFAQKTIIS